MLSANGLLFGPGDAITVVVVAADSRRRAVEVVLA